MRALADWLDHRTGHRAILHALLMEPIPGGPRWRYVWGSTLTFTFFVQVVTGFLLWASYSPSAQTAWESVYYIQHVATLGWLIRGIHHYSAQAMVVLLVLHFMQVVLDGAYKAPREVNFWLGLVLMQIVLGLSLTGYLLPWDQKGYYATKVATNILGVTPLVGPELQRLVQGGSDYGHHTLTRFFALHAGVLPALLVVFLSLHLYVFRRHAITPAPPYKNPRLAGILTVLFGPVGLFYSSLPGAVVLLLVQGGIAYAWWQLGVPEFGTAAFWIAAAIAHFGINAAFCMWGMRSAREFKTTDGYFWPEQVLKDAVACLAVLATVLILTVYFGAHLTAPADPSENYTAARPEWYFLFLFRFLKFEFVEHLGLVFGAIVVPSLVLLVIVAMPFIGRWRAGHWFNVIFLSALLAGSGYLTLLAIYDDQTDPQFKAAVAAAHRDGERAVELAQAYGVPVEGARFLLRNDPATQGPRLFAQKCAGCHRYNGHDGLGQPVMNLAGEKPEPAPATASDLGNFGTREWIRSVLVDYKKVFAPLEHATWGGQPVGEAFLTGMMAEWSDAHRERLTSPENKESLNALVEFLAAQSRRGGAEAYDAELVKKGREVFTSGALAAGALDSNCTDCHALKPVGEEEVLGTSGTAPSLTGYGGQEWLKAFIAHPESEEFYGSSTNAMPAFAEMLTPQEIELLARWLTGDYYRGDQAKE